MLFRLLRAPLIATLMAFSCSAHAQLGNSTELRVSTCGNQGGTLRIMPLGDSITEAAVGHNSYRRDLYFNLKRVGCKFDFVGSQSGVYGAPSAPNGDFDQRHEGHWGWRVDEIASQVTSYIAYASPDIVLIHLGSNDIFQNENPANVAQELGSLIDTIRQVKPDTEIMLAKLISSSYNSQGITALNALIDGVASSRSYAPYPPVIVVDQASGYLPYDNYDGVHPAPSGEARIARRWSRAIFELAGIGN
jgi:acyl-CoA thioesterase I